LLLVEECFDGFVAHWARFLDVSRILAQMSTFDTAVEYKDGKPKECGKYLAPPGRKNMIYFVPGLPPELLEDVTKRCWKAPTSRNRQTRTK
jgi:hypothetical protein